MSENIKVGSKITATAHELDFKGQGVIRYDDLIIFVKGLLKDEEALIYITKVKKSFALGNIVKITKPSKLRKCDNSNLGSLDLIHLDDTAQSEWQREVTENTFKKIIEKSIDTDKIIDSKKYTNYRNKSVFHVMSHKPLKLGLYDNDHKLVEVNEFILSDDLTNGALAYINASKIYLENTNLKHIVFRTNEAKELMVILVTKLRDKSNDKLIEKLLTFSGLKSIYLNISPSKRHILGEQSYLIYGEKYLMETYGDKHVYFNDQSFLQTNYSVADLLYKAISSHISKGDEVIDAYSGVGSIGFYLLDKASKVHLLESNEASIKMMRKAIKDFNYTNTFVHKGDVINSIDKLKSDVLIVDPPRSGMSDFFIDQILAKDFNKIIYLSCNITSQARDINLLLEKYVITDIHPVKMFYQTTATENLVILERK